MKLICTVSIGFHLFREHFHACIRAISLFRLSVVSSFLNIETSFAPTFDRFYHAFVFIYKFYLSLVFRMLEYIRFKLLREICL